MAVRSVPVSRVVITVALAAVKQVSLVESVFDFDFGRDIDLSNL